MTDYSTSLRTDRCGDLRVGDVGRQVTLCGWVDRRREHGEHLAFVDLRDRSGVVQLVIDGAHDLRSEYVLQVTGTVRERPADTANDGLATGAVEVDATDVTILSTAEPPPFPLDDRIDVDEVVRLRHRYVDLRRPRMQRNLEVRARVNSAIRQAMEEQGFVEVETPMLIASTPEGARDFVVPSRKEPGSFYALPQSPQIFKQLCMVGGVDRYYRLPAACVTRTSGPTASSSSCSSTPRPVLSPRMTYWPSFRMPSRRPPKRLPASARERSPGCRGTRPWSALDPTSLTSGSAWSWLN